MRAWVAGLPTAHASQAAQQLRDALEEVNQLDLGPRERFRVLETLREPIRAASLALQRVYLGERFPLSPRRRAIAELDEWFQRNLATGYKIIVDDLSRSRFGSLGQRTLLAAALHRAIQHSGRVLLVAYQVYSSYPEHLWHDLHQLFLYATEQGVAGRMVRDGENALVMTTSIADAYKRVLLLSLCSPYRLRHGEVGSVFHALERWAPYCSLTQLPGNRHGRGLFAIHPESDEQPNHLDLESQGSNPLGWILDTADLSRRLQGLLFSAKSRGAATRAAPSLPPGLTVELVHRLMISWGIMSKRSFPRESKDHSQQFILGLPMIHQLLAMVVMKDVEELWQAENQNDLPGVQDWLPAEARPSNVEIHRGKVLNGSVGGMRLRWVGDGKVRVGELIGLRPHDGERVQGRPWCLGVIRWMQAVQGVRLDMGVQLLSDVIEPVSVRVYEARGSRREHLPALLLPPQGPKRPRASLITSAFLRDFPARLILTGSRGERLIKLNRSVESSGSFVQFHFSILGGDEGDAPHEPLAQHELETLWSSL